MAEGTESHATTLSEEMRQLIRTSVREVLPCFWRVHTPRHPGQQKREPRREATMVSPTSSPPVIQLTHRHITTRDPPWHACRSQRTHCRLVTLVIVWEGCWQSPAVICIGVLLPVPSGANTHVLSVVRIRRTGVSQLTISPAKVQAV